MNAVLQKQKVPENLVIKSPLKSEQKHEVKGLNKRQIKRLVKNLPINKLGPSLIPFAVTDKFLSPYKIFKKVRLSEINQMEGVA